MFWKIFWACIIAILVIIAIALFLFFRKYQTSENMVIPIEEPTAEEYPEDPMPRGDSFNTYGQRSLQLTKTGPTTFTFTFVSDDPKVATITFKDVDLSLFVPLVPEWAKGDQDIEVITLVEREYNRQQVYFSPDSDHIEISGGDGTEVNRLVDLELHRNCLNAGLWEVVLYEEEGDDTVLFYHGWFDFPLGYYKDVFEKINGISYWKHWFRLEHWVDPDGRMFNKSHLREVVKEHPIPFKYDLSQPVLAEEEQARKREIIGNPPQTWSDVIDPDHEISLPTFAPPGRYYADRPWGDEYSRFTTLEQALWRQVISPARKEPLDELELVFRDATTDQTAHFVVSGISLKEIPALPAKDYSQGLYMPMGVAIPPVSQEYHDLQQNPPSKSPYFSVLLDDQERWINHHQAAVDGVAIHWDENNPNLLQVYLLAYERHHLVGHYTLDMESVMQFIRPDVTPSTEEPPAEAA